MKNCPNRKIELFRIDILNNDDINDLYNSKIILQDLLIDFFNHFKYNESDPHSFKVNNEKKFWIEDVELKDEDNLVLLNIKLTYSKYNKNVTIVNVNTRKSEGSKNKDQGDLEKLHLTIRFFKDKNYALIIFEKVLDSIPMSILHKYIKNYFRTVFLKRDEHKKNPKINSVLLSIQPIANKDFIENVSSLKSIKLLQATVLKEIIDEDISFSSESNTLRDDVDLTYKSKYKTFLSKPDVINYCKKFITNGSIRGTKVKRIIICGQSPDNSSVRLDTEGMKLYRTVPVKFDDNNTIDSDDLFTQFKNLIINQHDEIMNLFNVTIKESDEDGVSGSSEDDALESDEDGVSGSSEDDALDSDEDGVSDSSEDDALDSDEDGVSDSSEDDALDSDEDGALDSDEDGALDSSEDVVLNT